MLNIKRIFSTALLLSFFFTISIQAQKINQLDVNGKRTGVWKKFYDNGKIRYSGQFINGKEVGVFKFYTINSSSQPSIVKKYRKNSDTALVTFYTGKGTVKTEGKMLGKKRIGKWIYYFFDGEISSEEEYSNGSLNGVLKNYYRNGKLTEETAYQFGKKHGVSKIYTNAGILIENVSYVAGKLEGEGKYYDLKGDLKEKGIYKNGKRVGKWEFYMDGEIVSDKRKRNTHSIPKR